SPRDQVRAAIAQDRVAPDADLNSFPSGTPTEQLSRGDLVRAVLANPRLKLLDRLAGKGPLRAVLFGAQPHPIAEESHDPEAKTVTAAALQQRLAAVLDPSKNADAFSDTQTALADVLGVVLQPRHGEDLPAAVIVVTDGRDNASKSTLDEAGRDCAAA